MKRFDQDIKNRAKEKSLGMFSITINGKFLPDPKDRNSMQYEGACSKKDFDAIGAFIGKLIRDREKL